jgi:hypothetical protein
MKDNYDFSNSVQNPYYKKLKKPISIRLDEDVSLKVVTVLLRRTKRSV